MSKPRIYIAIATFHPLVGGAETQALAQGRMLQERGYEPTVITFRHKKHWRRRDMVEGVPVIRVAGELLAGRERFSRPLQQLLYMLALLTMGMALWRDRHKYDLLHVYQLSLLALPTALVCRLTGKPMLISVRSTGTGHSKGSHSSTSLIAGPLDPSMSWLHIEGQTWVDGDLEALLRLGRPVVRFARALLRSIGARVVILSTRMQSYLAANDFTLPDLQLIPNGVDVNHYRPLHDEAQAEQRARTIVCVSRLRYEKGIDVLLQAWYLVQQQMPQARLVLVGSGRLEPQLLSMAQALGLMESVEFAGMQSDVAGQFHRGTVAVLPSRWEGMPNAVLEAMACGLPCVATRVSGSEDIIIDGVNGLLVDSEDYEGMAEALLTLLCDPALTQQYGQAARTRIEQQYSLEHITDIYLDLYQSMGVPRPPVIEEGDAPPSEMSPVSL